jgi:hypothetical protein
MIDAFAFGSMVIDGRSYHSDLIIFPDGRVQDSWRRIQGHVLSKQDIVTLIKSEPMVIIAGAGVNGRMRPEPGIESFLSKKNIQFIIAPNRQAVDWYNTEYTNQKVGACFHLTC